MVYARLQYLLLRYYNNTASDVELDELMELVQQPGNEHIIKQVMEETWAQQGHPKPVFSAATSEVMLHTVLQAGAQSIPAGYTGTRTGRTGWRYRLAAAAILLLLVSVGWWALLYKPLRQPATVKKEPVSAPHDIQPGSNKAILQLADGSTIVLNNTGKRSLARQGNVQVVQSDSGKLEYLANGHSKPAFNTYNTLITPRGGQFQVVLPDGTKVWLNAASSIRYPTVFNESERRVEVSGEVYFEVAHLTAPPARGGGKVPFIVSVHPLAEGGRNSEVEVLGTHFNINAYDDEPTIKTTLLEGAVKINCGNRNALLQPSQQASYSNDDPQNNTPIRVIPHVNVEDVVAWKNGFFQYKSVDLPSVMRQVARWYDLNIVYAGNIPTDRFTGKIPRSVSIARLLKWLEWSDIHFKIEGKTMIVTQ